MAWALLRKADGMASDVVPSEELRALLARCFRVISAGDAAALEELFSSQAYVVLIGSDPDEWLRGGDAVAVFSAQLGELRAIELEPSEIVAFCSGDVGWAAASVRQQYADGHALDKRITAVFVIERGHWRIAQWHTSVGVGNEQTAGYALTTSIERMVFTVRESRPDVTPASAPDGTVTLMFSDIESSTVLLERLGDTNFLALLGWHDRIVRDAASEHRGYVVKSQGDGFMIAFPSAAYALRCALAIRQRLEPGYDGIHVRVRIGLHAGEAIRHADDFYGRTVVIAARIGALALGGEILASELVHELARGLGTFTFGEPRAATLKGLNGDFELYPVTN